MGAYLSEPITEKESCSGGGHGHVWGCSAMQGWRTGMEDSHLTISDLGGDSSGVSLFGVFDGHGGAQVATFASRHLPDELRRRLAGKEEFESALREGFHSMDDLLRASEGQQEIIALSKSSDCGSSSGSGAAAASGEANDAGAPSGEAGKGGAAGRKSKVSSALQTSIENDLHQARAKGSLSKEEATQVMMKMALLRRLDAQGMGDEGKEPEPGTAADTVGCTAVCVLMTRHEVVCANAGDSRAVLCRGGKAVPLSYDHKPNSEIERRRIEAAGGTVEHQAVGAREQYRVNGNLNLSRSIGDLEYKKRSDLGPEAQVICATPDIIRMKLVPEDEFFIIACDGIWDVKTNEEAVDFVRLRLARGATIATIIEELLDECISKDPKATQGLGCDNMTCLVVQLTHTESL
eukprot:gnl/TRDRNA2_/TRDRNA2_99822_c1_seq2.p1 gnl/TRDRNA2_/TRDRNA2_99822_c1~~gnl/TRDRNA2_/TRDRNA2_99822_c1_seq2.p1  ORF type:complete len:406 (-),score=81.58 gnl/TRDRNA2_/TRDRNA2_99822_c1_seq2:120-1337(-)